MAIAPKHVGAH